MYTNEEINLITLSGFSLPYEINKKLLSDLDSAEPDFKKYESFLIKTFSRGVYNKVTGDYGDSSYRAQILRELEKKAIKCVTYFSDDYPETLKNIKDPPFVLYCKGDTHLLRTRCFSIVGSRRTLPKILSSCKKISGELSQEFTIVTGLAEGADSKAIEGALDNGGKVVSVLANGLDHIYPSCNAGLLRKVAQSGLVITEHLPQEKPKPYYFPIRNRIIAGLSVGTLVVSAGAKSGAVITANYANDYGRDVFAFPYCADVNSGEGCNELIKNGASLTRNVLDIFAEYGLDLKRRKKIELSETEKTVFDLIKKSGEAFLPEIADKLNKPIAEITTVIMSLTIKGLAAGIGGNRYVAIQ